MRVLATQARRLSSIVVKYRFVLAMVILAFAYFAVPLSKNHQAVKPALACEHCACVSIGHSLMRANIRLQHQLTRLYIRNQLVAHRGSFIVPWFFGQHIVPTIMMMTEQLTAGAMHQMLILGSFFDAENTLDAQFEAQKLRARAHKDYHPSVGMCEVGTMVRSLASSQRLGETNAATFNRRQHARQKLSEYSSGGGGPEGKGGQVTDKESRVEQFVVRYCDIRDQGGDLELLCKPINSGAAAASAPVRIRNNDVAYSRVLDSPRTININYTNTTVFNPGNPANAGNDEQRTEIDLMALSSNLYADDIFPYIEATALDNAKNHPLYYDTRAILAKRSVAMNSFNALVGMKTQGSPDSDRNSTLATGGFMAKIYEQLGFEDSINGGGPTDIEVLLGENPSYYAQMEVLTKKLYQRPEFYTNLYDKPANVDRISASLQAISVMQNMDRFKSQLRSEATVSVWLETEIAESQENVNARIDKQGDKGPTRTKP